MLAKWMGNNKKIIIKAKIRLQKEWNYRKQNQLLTFLLIFAKNKQTIKS